MDMNEKTIEDALNLLISGELDLVDTALGEVSNIKTYAEAGIPGQGQQPEGDGGFCEEL